mmetsp:Transcript_54172/g.61282  ORF Transcript_54172/g.61282 Transcript_54172/m.61282 type:complete len:120 (-) Transcript_54172:465-824(-)
MSSEGCRGGLLSELAAPIGTGPHPLTTYQTASPKSSRTHCTVAHCLSPCLFSQHPTLSSLWQSPGDAALLHLAVTHENTCGQSSGMALCLAKLWHPHRIYTFDAHWEYQTRQVETMDEM